MRKMQQSIIVTTTLAVLMGAAGVACADGVVPVRTGSTVRIFLTEPKYGSLREPKTREGVLVSLTATEIELATSPGNPPLLLPRSGIEKYELKTRVGRRTHGALWGAGIGAATGLIYGAAIVGNTENDPDEWFGMTALENGAVAAAFLALPCAAIGALVAPGEQWQQFDPSAVQVGWICGQRGALGLRIAKQF